MIRTSELTLEPELTDCLLDSLDRVNGWIDHLEAYASLPKDADAISRAGAARLRVFAEPPALALVPDPIPEGASVQSEAAPRLWLEAMPETTRREAFRRACAGETILALRYRPNESCFYNGTDPLGTMLQIGELIGFHAGSREPIEFSTDFDPYRCIFDYAALTAAPRTELEHLFRYDIEEVEIDELLPADLAVPAGEEDMAVIWTDFVTLARAHLKAGDTAALRAAALSLAGITASTLRPASALRWIEAAVEAGPAGHALLQGLIDAIVPGLPEIAASVSPALTQIGAQAGAEAQTQTVDWPEGVAGETAREILASQKRDLAGGGCAPEHVPAIRHVLAQLARGLGAPWLASEIDACDDALPLLALCEGFAPPARGELAVNVEPARAPEPERSAATPDAPPAAPAPPAQRQLKVDQAKIDLMMNLIGELVVSKNSLPFLARRAEEVYGSREMGREIKEQYAIIDRLAQEMQSAVMQVRMLPVSDVFVRFPRLVRDMARKLGKQIALKLEGGDTAADKTIIEALGDPLLHIMRNSLDHGIETAEERRASGKPEEATIRLSASQVADNVVIELSDDGRGIDPVRIRRAAVAKGVITEEVAARLSDQDAINLIYAPGFSTAAEISDLSGRGVGMDVVLTTIQRLGGSVSVTSEVGLGTRTQLSLPLSMAVTRVMVIEAGGTLYGIPMDLIVETVRVSAASIHTIKRAETFVLRNTVIPLRRLVGLLGLPQRLTVPEEEAVLVCRVNGHQVGLVIDDFREGIEVLLKPLEGVLSQIRGYSGTALLGDGRVLLVLNLKEIL